MTDRPGEFESLVDCRVALAGRPAAVSRGEFRGLVDALGGRFVTTVDTRTSYVVLGGSGWPFAEDGRLERAIRQTLRLRRAGAGPVVLREHDFLARFHQPSSGPTVRRLYSRGELTHLAKVSRRKLQEWIDRGWLAPCETRHGIPYFDFEQAAGLRHLARLSAAGVTTRRLAAGLREMQQWLPQASAALLRLTQTGDDGGLLLRTSDGRPCEPGGQLLFEFEPAVASPPLQYDDHRSEETLLDEALVCNADGRHARAAEIYERLLARRPTDARLRFNFGNALFALGRREEALHAFRTAVEFDPNYVEAWNNLGVVLIELERFDDAEQALQSALAVAPDYRDARDNLRELARITDSPRQTPRR